MDRTTVSGRKFFVYVAGNTNESHQEYVRKLTGVGHFEVKFSEDSDYVLVFCPVVSRVGTDINEALKNVPDGKPIILVVMHHTYDPEVIVAESRRQVENPNVFVTVDCVFHEKTLHSCNRNDIAWFEISKTLEFSQVDTSESIKNWLWNNRRAIFAGVIVVMVTVVVVATAAFLSEKK